jgi:hypothetical protein
MRYKKFIKNEDIQRIKIDKIGGFDVHNRP